MKIDEVISYFERRIPLKFQESYDNSGLLLGDRQENILGALIAIDLTVEVIEEAIHNDCNLIITHHPFIFSGIKHVTSDSEIGKMIYMLIRNNIAVYVAHTNLDNIREGINGILAKKINLTKTHILRPMQNQLRKLIVYCPLQYAEKVRSTLFEIGAGCIGNYDMCSFNVEGNGTFRAGNNSYPFVGEKGRVHIEKEIRIEVIYPAYIEHRMIEKMREVHPYEEPAYDCIPLTNDLETVGAGMIGELEHPMRVLDFLNQVKETLQIPIIRHSNLCRETIRKVAICGGSGSFLIDDAVRKKADIILTGDLKYHDFQRAEDKIIIVDIGHYESEQFAKELIYSEMSENFSNFVVRISEKGRSFVTYM